MVESWKTYLNLDYIFSSLFQGLYSTTKVNFGPNLNMFLHINSMDMSEYDHHTETFIRLSIKQTRELNNPRAVIVSREDISC